MQSPQPRKSITIGATTRLKALLARLFRPADLTRAEAEAIGRGFHVTLLPPPAEPTARR